MMDIIPAYGHIYCFTNTVNGKQYVGQTTNIESRLKDHWRARDDRNLLHCSIRKYGAEAITVAVLCTCNSQEELDTQEIYYVQTLNTFAPNGYNLRAGRGRGVMSNNTKEKLRIVSTGRKRSRDSVERSRVNLIKHYQSPAGNETRRKLREIQARSNVTPERKALRITEMKARWSNEEYRTKIIESTRKSWENSEIRQRRVAGLRRVLRTPEARAMASRRALAVSPDARKRAGEGVRRFYQDPVAKAKHSQKIREVQSRPELQAKRRETLRRHYQNPEARQRQREILRAIWQRPEVREKHRIAVRKALANPETRKKISERVKAAMTPERCKRQSELMRGRKVSDATRAKLHGINSKVWRFFSADGTPYEISDLKTFCKEQGLYYQCMLDLARGRQREHKGWRFTKELRPSQRGQRDTYKTYHLISPEGERVTVTDLKRFCEEHGLYYGTMCKVAVGKPWYNQHKGWRRDTEQGDG